MKQRKGRPNPVAKNVNAAHKPQIIQSAKAYKRQTKHKGRPIDRGGPFACLVLAHGRIREGRGSGKAIKLGSRRNPHGLFGISICGVSAWQMRGANCAPKHS